MGSSGTRRHHENEIVQRRTKRVRVGSTTSGESLSRQKQKKGFSFFRERFLFLQSRRSLSLINVESLFFSFSFRDLAEEEKEELLISMLSLDLIIFRLCLTESTKIKLDTYVIRS
jgi:hypothetical protein